MANDLRVGIVADASSLDAVMDSSAGKVETFANRATTAMERYNATCTKGKAAQEQLGAAFDQATAAGKSTTEAMEEAVAAYEQLTAASTTAAASQERVAVSMAGTTSSTIATNGALRVMEGSLIGSTRAAGSFLANTLQLGPALAAAFPVIGAAALAMVLIDVGRELKKFSDNAQDLADELNTGWLEGAILEMSGFGDEVKKTEKEIEALNKDIDAQITKQKELSFAQTGRREGPGGEATARAQDLQKSADGMRIYIDLQRQMLKQDQEDADTKAKAAQSFSEDPGLVNIATGKAMSAAAAAASERVKEDIARLKDLEATLQTMGMTGTSLAQEAGDSGVPKAVKGSTKESSQEKEFFRNRMRNYEEYTRRVEKDTKEQEEFLDHFWDNQLAAAARAEEFEKHMAQGAAREAEEHKRYHEQQMRILEEEIQGTVQAAEAEQQRADRYLENQARMGKMSPKQAAQGRIDASNLSQAAQVNAVGSELAGTDRQSEPAKYQALQNKITEIQRKGAAQREQIAQQEAQREQQQYAQMFQRMYAPLNEFTDHWLTSNRNMGQAAIKMADSYAITMINALMKVAAQELIGLAIKKTVGDQKALIDAKGAATGAYNATVDIPVVGPVLAPIAAATAFAAVLAFEKGTDYVPRTGMAILHEGERVSTRPENEAISKALQGGNGGSGGDNHYHYSPNISGIDGASVAGMARQHGNMFMRQAARQMRLMGRSQAA